MSSNHCIVRLRRGTAAEWAASQPQPGGEVLKLGEPGYEKDTGKLKIGDGTTPWNSLSYFNDGAVIDPEELQDLIGDSGFLVAGTGIVISYNDGADSLTISTSGVSLAGHTHISTDISDSTSFGRNMLTAVSYAAQNKLGWQEIDTGFWQAKSGGQYFLQPKPFVLAARFTITDPASPALNDFYTIVKYPGGQPISVGGIDYDNPVIIYRIYNQTSLIPTPTYGWSTYTLNNFHTHTSSEITDFNTAVSGLLPVKDIVAGPNMSVSSSSGIYTISTDDESSALVTTVFNKTGSPIPKFSVVYINGGQGDMPTIALASASGEMTSSKTYGITSENIAHMSTGKVIVDGALTGVNTDQFNPTAPTGDVNGAVLYLSPTTPGGVTTTKPSAPNHMVSVGTIIRTHQNEGVVEVKIQNGYELQELHNVAISGVTTGQMLYYNASNLWAPTSGISYNPITNLIVFDNDLGLGYTPGIFFGDDGDAAILYSATNEISIDALRINLSDSYMNSRLVSTVPYVLSLGTLTGSNAINYGDDRNIQTLTLNGTAVTFTKGTGWPTSISGDVVLKITVSSPTTITWTIVNEWYNQAPAGALAVGTHLFLLRVVGTTIEGHYIGYKTAP